MIVALRWFTTAQHGGTVIGVVASLDEKTKTWKAYIGVGSGRGPEEADARAIAERGAKLDPASAAAFAEGRIPSGFDPAS